MTSILETLFNGVFIIYNKSKIQVTFLENKDLNISELTCDLKVTIEIDDSCLITCIPESKDYLPFSIKTEQLNFNDSTDYRIKIINVVLSYWEFYTQNPHLIKSIV